MFRRSPARLVTSTYCLALGTVAVGTSGHSIAGLLPMLSADLHTSPALIGQLATVFALTCGLAGPVLAVATGRWERRTLLVASLLTCGLGNGLAAVAGSYGLLAAGRVVTALGAAVTTAVAVGIAAAANPPAQRGRAIAVVLSGLTAALILGVPAANLVGDALGHRAVLGLVAGLCVLAGLVVLVAAPTVPAPAALPLRQRLAVVADPQVRRVLGGGLALWTSTFVLYPYLTALLTGHHGTATGAHLSLLLAVYGLGAAVGNVAGGAAVDRLGPRRPLIAAALLCAAVLAVLPLAADAIGPAVLLAAWGAASWSVGPALNARLLETGGPAPLLLTLTGSCIYLGMGLGGLLGGLVLALYDVQALPAVAAAVAVLAAARLALPDVPADAQPIR